MLVQDMLKYASMLCFHQAFCRTPKRMLHVFQSTIGIFQDCIKCRWKVKYFNCAINILKKSKIIDIRKNLTSLKYRYLHVQICKNKLKMLHIIFVQKLSENLFVWCIYCKFALYHLDCDWFSNNSHSSVCQ